nr:hypothetical protein [Pandoravirus massiliensis]
MTNTTMLMVSHRPSHIVGFPFPLSIAVWSTPARAWKCKLKKEEIPKCARVAKDFFSLFFIVDLWRCWVFPKLALCAAANRRGLCPTLFRWVRNFFERHFSGVKEAGILCDKSHKPKEKSTVPIGRHEKTNQKATQRDKGTARRPPTKRPGGKTTTAERGGQEAEARSIVQTFFASSVFSFSFSEYKSTKMNKRAFLDRFMPLPEPRERKGRLVTNNPLHAPCAPEGWLGIVEPRDYDDDSLVDRIREKWHRAFEPKAAQIHCTIWEEQCEERWLRDSCRDPIRSAAHIQNIANRRVMPRYYRYRLARDFAQSES